MFFSGLHLRIVPDLEEVVNTPMMMHRKDWQRPAVAGDPDRTVGASTLPGVETHCVNAEEFEANLAFKEQVELFRYWNRLRKEKPFSRRRQFDPVQVFNTLGSLGLIDIEYPEADDAAPEFRYRLVGSDIQDFFSESLKGKTVPEAKKPAYSEYLTYLYRLASDAGAAVCVQENNILPSGYYNFRGRIYLPSEPDDAGRPSILIYSTLDPQRAEMTIPKVAAESFPRDVARIWILERA